MTRKTTPQPLTLADHSVAVDEYENDSPRSPYSVKSPKSPRSPFRFNSSKKSLSGLPSMQAAEPQTRSDLPPSQSSSALEQYSSASGGQQRQERERPAISSFFSNYKAAKSSSRLQNSESARPFTEDSMSRDTDHPSMAGKVTTKEMTRTESGDRSLTRRPVGGPSRSDVSLDSQTDPQPSSSANVIRKGKPKPFSLLSRTRSIRDEQSPREPSPNSRLTEPEKAQTQTDSGRTAPLPPTENDRSFRSMMSSSVRQNSADRQPTAPRDIEQGKVRKENGRQKDARENGRSQTMAQKENNQTQNSFSSSFREGSSHTFLANLKSGATKGAGAMAKGLFGKGGRSGSTTQKEPVVDDEHYELKVINLPLVQQTRKTRISKKLEDSRDKTEFWMPAFPWRAIDYLNYKGSDVEGLYRIPGSGPQIKKWQRRFDEELDIDLFEQDDLYDINIIGSMLKAWLRELPDELLPKSAQDRIARSFSGSDPPSTVPQMLIDELSNLSPFNYYLLFAITCHLSLLLAHSEQNKMDYRNLCICFQPCMKIDAFCFKFLVCDWRDCWKGCKTEPQYIEQEYMLFDKVMTPGSAGGHSSTAVESHDEHEHEQEHERNVSSSDSSKPSSVSIDNNGAQAKSNSVRTEKKLPFAQTQSSAQTVSTTLTVVEERTTPPRMRPLSPIKPSSPIVFEGLS